MTSLLEIIIQSYFNIENIFDPFVLLNVILIISGLLLIWPLYISYKNYKRVQSSEYLLLAFILLLFIMNSLTGPLDELLLMDYPNYADIPIENFIVLILNQLIMGFTGSVAMLLLFFHALRLIWKDPPRWLMIGVVLIHLPLIMEAIFYFTYLIVIRDFASYIDPYETIFWVFSQTQILGYAAVVVSYSVTKNIIKNRITQIGKIIWIVFGLIGTGSSLLYLLNFLGLFTVLYDNYFTEYIVVAILLYALSNIILFFYAAIFPTTLLISEAQVLRACKLYSILHADEQSLIPDKSLAPMVKYLKSIPPSVFEEGCK